MDRIVLVVSVLAGTLWLGMRVESSLHDADFRHYERTLESPHRAERRCAVEAIILHQPRREFQRCMRGAEIV